MGWKWGIPIIGRVDGVFTGSYNQVGDRETLITQAFAN